MTELQRIHFKNRETFRNWLKDHHDQSPGIWLIFFKKHTRKENIPYNEAVEEAICYGWIDSIVKRIDDESYIQKFSPRRNIKNWSDVNKARAISLMENGQMTEAGLNKIDVYLKTGNLYWDIPDDKGVTPQRDSIPKDSIPAFIFDAFSNNQPALENFNKLAPSYRRHYIGWISSAKREATRQKRISEAIDLLKKNEKLGLK